MTVVFERVSRINGLDNGFQHVVLNDISLTFPGGRSIGILGTRGSGKSTLIKLLSGSVRPTSGKVLCEGRVSFPVGSFGWMNRFMTGRENLRFLAQLYGIPPALIIDFVVEFSGLGYAIDQLVGAYSGEKRARLAFATSYAVPFDIYLADEYLIGGPPGFRDLCKTMVRQRQRHSTFILVTRSPALVRMFCDVGGVMHNGTLRLFETVQDAVLEFAAVTALATTPAETDSDADYETGFWDAEALTDAA